jgi:hypothetical protein
VRGRGDAPADGHGGDEDDGAQGPEALMYCCIVSTLVRIELTDMYGNGVSIEN